jgi:hypothetical protein
MMSAMTLTRRTLPGLLLTLTLPAAWLYGQAPPSVVPKTPAPLA